MRVLAACSMGGLGHLLPLAPFVEAAVRRGGTAAVLAPRSMADAVAALGVELLAGEEPSEEVVAPIREQLAVAPPEAARVLSERELFGRLAAGALLPAAREAFERWRPELLVREPCEWASALARPAEVPAAQVAIGLAAGELACLEVAAPVLEAERPGVADQVGRQAYLTAFPASLDPSPWPRTIRYRRPVPPPGPPLPEWWASRRDPLVYVTLGTVTGYLRGAATIYRAVMEAVSALAVRVLLTTGSRLDPAALGPLPKNVHVESWVDQGRVLPEAAAVVCHGGSGTVWGALAAGVPVVVVPGFADQAANGSVVEGAGAGLVVARSAGPDGGRHPVGHEDVAAIRKAVGTVLAGPAFVTAARDLAAELAAPPPAEVVLAELTG